MATRRTLLIVTAMALVTLWGCRRRDELVLNPITPSADMETALEVTNDVTTATLLATELTRAVGADEESQKANTCPIVTRSLGSVTIDYGTGCVPESGLLPKEIAGSLTLTRDALNRTVTGTFSGLTYDQHGIDGEVSGSYTRQGTEGLDLTESMDLTIGIGGDTLGLVEDVTVQIRTTEVLLEGAVDYTDPTTVFSLDAEGVAFEYVDLLATCPLPHAGLVTVAWDTKVVSIAFQEHSPDTGYVTVTMGPVSGDVPLCEYLGFL